MPDMCPVKPLLTRLDNLTATLTTNPSLQTTIHPVTYAAWNTCNYELKLFILDDLHLGWIVLDSPRKRSGGQLQNNRPPASLVLPPV